MTTLTITDLESHTRDELLVRARELEVRGLTGLKKQDIILRILQAESEAEGNVLSGGVLEVVDDSYGFLRGESLLPAPTDVYVSQAHVRGHDLRSGDYVIGPVRPPKSGEKYYGLQDAVLVNGAEPELAKQRPHFATLTAVFPHQRFTIESEDPTELSGRVIDLVAPMGRGQRGLIVSPPKAGKTMLLQAIANGIATNHPDVHLMVVLIGERPEEVTEMRRTVRGEVVASTFDEPVEDHTRCAELGLERAKRLMEMGRDVVILLDSITRLTRAYNLEMPSTGRTLSGGIDPIALYPPKRFFGSARKAEEGGSLTIIATCLVDNRQPARRRGLRGVQGHWQLGGATRPQALRAAHLPLDRHRREQHAPRGAAALGRGAAAHVAAAPHDVGAGRLRRQQHGADRASARPSGPDQDQHRVPREPDQRRSLIPFTRIQAPTALRMEVNDGHDPNRARTDRQR